MCANEKKNVQQMSPWSEVSEVLLSLAVLTHCFALLGHSGLTRTDLNQGAEKHMTHTDKNE